MLAALNIGGPAKRDDRPRRNGLPVEGTLTDPKFIYEGGVRYMHDKRLDWMPEDHAGFKHPWGNGA